MKFRHAVLLAALAAATALSPARAGTPGWYIGGEGGYTDLEDATGNANAGLAPAAPNGSGQFKFDNGFAVGGFGGYNFGAFRLEGEFAYRHNDNKSVSANGTSYGLGGNTETKAFMANGIYNFSFLPSQWTPYIGGGVGAAIVDANSYKAAGVKFLDDSDTEFAYQAIGGIDYQINPKVSLGLDYRYFSTLDPKFSTVNGIGGGSVKSEYHTHNVMLNVTYHFGAPPPPPPAVPAAAPMPAPPPAPQQQTFVVFFDFDKSTLTPEGRAVVDLAITHAQSGRATRIEVNGYTDTMGTVAYNLALSQRRARTVHDYMVAHGIPDSEIATQGFGKTNLRVPTADGVREPQNRRVEIVF